LCFDLFKLIPCSYYTEHNGDGSPKDYTDRQTIWTWLNCLLQYTWRNYSLQLSFNLMSHC